MRTADFSFGAMIAGTTLVARRIDIGISVKRAESELDWARTFTEIHRAICIVFGEVPQRDKEELPMRVLVPFQHAELDTLHLMAAGGFIQTIAVEGETVTAKELAKSLNELIRQRLRGIKGTTDFPPVLRGVKVRIGSPAVDEFFAGHYGETNDDEKLDGETAAA